MGGLVLYFLFIAVKFKQPMRLPVLAVKARSCEEAFLGEHCCCSYMQLRSLVKLEHTRKNRKRNSLQLCEKPKGSVLIALT